jgi:hypothetical protein
MQNVSTEDGLFNANMNKRGLCPCANGAPAEAGPATARGLSYFFPLLAWGKDAQHLFYERKGRLAQTTK